MSNFDETIAHLRRQHSRRLSEAARLEEDAVNLRERLDDCDQGAVRLRKDAEEIERAIGVLCGESVVRDAS